MKTYSEFSKKEYVKEHNQHDDVFNYNINLKNALDKIGKPFSRAKQDERDHEPILSWLFGNEYPPYLINLRTGRLTSLEIVSVNDISKQDIPNELTYLIEQFELEEKQTKILS